jgi:diguanylate cyclase (GGDEF)-like protein/PAS domain S-box-containing protein
MMKLLHKNILESLDCAVILIDQDRNILYQNTRARQLSGCSDDTLSSCKCFDLFGDADKECLHDCIVERVLQGETLNDMQRTIKTRNGLTSTVTLTASPFVSDGSIAGAIVVLKDITVIQSGEKQDNPVADNNESLPIYDIYDEDTEQSIKDHFLERLKSDFALAKKYDTALSLIILEVDEFKKIENDFGHSYSDSLIQQVIDLLKGRLRRGDLIFRYNEGQIAIILLHAQLISAASIAEDIRTIIQDEFRSGGENHTVSIGTAEMRKGTADFHQLIEQAVMGTETAKKTGNTVITLQKP